MEQDRKGNCDVSGKFDSVIPVDASFLQSLCCRYDNEFLLNQENLKIKHCFVSHFPIFTVGCQFS